MDILLRLPCPRFATDPVTLMHRQVRILCPLSLLKLLWSACSLL